jgi:hypothetical protein
MHTEHVTEAEGCWEKLNKGAVNPDSGKGFMVKNIFSRSDIAPT